MGNRVVTPLPFTEGLDRASGKSVVRPNALRDVANMILEEGRARIRSGLLPVQNYVDDVGNPISHIIGGCAQRVGGYSIVVGYQKPTGRVLVYKVDSYGGAPEIIERDDGTPAWFDRPADADVPQVFLTETYGRVFMAHDEPNYAARWATYYYEPADNKLHAMVLDLGSGFAPVFFRGVTTHLSYLLGWGFGLNGDGDHPEMVRASMPADPLTFDKQHFWYAGQRSDPVLNIESNGEIALVLKQTDRYQIYGYDRATFGIRPIDAHSGLAGSHLSVGVNGQIFAWALEGPTVTDGKGPAQRIDLELDLDGFEPADLVAAGAASRGVAFYDHRLQIIVFCFGQRAYVLSIRNQNKWKWGYFEFARVVVSAFKLYHQGLSG